MHDKTTTNQPGFAAQLYRDEATAWDALLQGEYPDAVLIKPGHSARTYRCGGKILKIDLHGRGGPSLIGSEYELLSRVDGIAGDFKPNLKISEPDGAAILEMNIVTGELLSNLVLEQKPLRISVWGMIWTLVRISLRGVYYRQLRPRHTIVSPEGKYSFIDFGNSTRMTPLRALLCNFSPIAVLGMMNGGIRAFGLVHAVLKHRLTTAMGIDVQTRSRDLMRTILQKIFSAQKQLPPQGEKTTQPTKHNLTALDFSFQSNFSRNELRMDFPTPPQNFVDAEAALQHAVRSNKGVLADIRRYEIGAPCGGYYNFYCRSSINLIWEHLLKCIDFKSLRILDWYGAQGLLGIHAKLEGTQDVMYMEPDPFLRQSMDAYCEAFDITDIPSRTPDMAEARTFQPNLVFCLSARETDYAARLKELPDCQTIVLETAHISHSSLQDIKDLGFHVTAEVPNWNEPSSILVMTRNQV